MNSQIKIINYRQVSSVFSVFKNATTIAILKYQRKVEKQTGHCCYIKNRIYIVNINRKVTKPNK